MKPLKLVLPYLAITALGFYLLPLFMSDTGSAIIILMALIPLVCFTCAFLYSIKYALNWLYVAFVMIVFLPSVWLYYNQSALIYTAGYGIVALIGSISGTIVHRVRKNT